MTGSVVNSQSYGEPGTRTTAESSPIPRSTNRPVPTWRARHWITPRSPTSRTRRPFLMCNNLSLTSRVLKPLGSRVRAARDGGPCKSGRSSVLEPAVLVFRIGTATTMFERSLNGMCAGSNGICSAFRAQTYSVGGRLFWGLRVGEMWFCRGRAKVRLLVQRITSDFRRRRLRGPVSCLDAANIV